MFDYRYKLFLSLQLQQTKGGAPSTQKQDLSFLNEASPIYVTSFNSNHTACNSTTLTTAAVATSTGTAGLISATTITPTAVASTTTNASSAKPQTVPASGVALSTAIAVAGAAGTALKTGKVVQTTGNTSTAADRNANQCPQASAATVAASKQPPLAASVVGAPGTAGVTLTTAATSILTNHNSIFQSTPLAKLPSSLIHKKLTIARSLQHLEVKEEDDDDDDLAALGANLCNINFINYKNKHAEIPTPTTAALNVSPFVATAPLIVAGPSSTLGRRKSQQSSNTNTNTNTVTVSATVDVHHSAHPTGASTAYHDHIPPPLQLPPPNKIYVDAQTLTSPRLAKDPVVELPDVNNLAKTTTAQKPGPALSNTLNNNNLKSLSALSAAATAATKAPPATATAAASLAAGQPNNNNTQQQQLPCYTVHHLGTLQQLTKQPNATAFNAQSSQISNHSSTASVNASSSTQASSIITAASSASIGGATSASVSTTKNLSSNISNNCDLYISANNLQQTQQLQQHQQQLPPPRREVS